MAEKAVCQFPVSGSGVGGAGSLSYTTPGSLTLFSKALYSCPLQCVKSSRSEYVWFPLFCQQTCYLLGGTGTVAPGCVGQSTSGAQALSYTVFWVNALIFSLIATPAFRDVRCFQIFSLLRIHGGFNLHFVGFSQTRHRMEKAETKFDSLCPNVSHLPTFCYFCISSPICFLLLYFFMALLGGLERGRGKGPHSVCRADHKLTAAGEKTSPGEFLLESVLRSLRPRP